MNHDKEEKGIVAGYRLGTSASCSAEAVVPQQREAGLKREIFAVNNFSSMSWLMFLRESKPKFLSPNSFSTMAEITPTTSLVVEIPETRVLRVMRHHTNNSRTVIQITRKCTTLALQSWSSALYLNNII